MITREELREAVATALCIAEVGYSIKLTRLVDDISTYTAVIKGQPSKEFGSYNDASEYVCEIRERARVDAALAVIGKACAEVAASRRQAAQDAHQFYAAGEIDEIENAILALTGASDV